MDFSRSRSRCLGFEGLEDRRLLAGDCFQNPIEPLDVNNDRAFTIGDTRVVFSELVAGPTSGEGEPGSVDGFVDVNGDSQFTIGDLRHIFGATLEEIQGSQFDQVVEEIVEIVESSPSLVNLIENWQTEAGESIAATIDQLLATESDRIAALRADLEDLLANSDALIGALYDDLDSIVAAGLQNNEATLGVIRESADAIRSQVQQFAEQRFADHLDGDRIREQVQSLISQLDIDGLQDDIVGFIDEVEAGEVPLTEEAEALFELFRSNDLDLSLQGLTSLDTAEVRTGVLDWLNAYENSGRDLPAEAAELRDALDSGVTLLEFVLSRIDLPFLFGGLLF